MIYRTVLKNSISKALSYLNMYLDHQFGYNNIQYSFSSSGERKKEPLLHHTLEIVEWRGLISKIQEVLKECDLLNMQ